MFRFKGISSEDMNVVIEEEEHFIARAAQRYEIEEIEGKDGAEFDELGYSVVERPIKVQCLDITKIDDILAWLNGSGVLEYNGRISKARFYTELDPIRTANIRIIDTTFLRDPFWNKAVDNFIIVQDNVANEGNYESKPIIRLEKTEDDVVELTIGGVRFKYTFNGENYVEIDTKTKKVTFENLNRNRQIEIDWKFPRLQVGNNPIIFNSGECIVKIKRKDLWL